jgi:hypothetical protein
MFPKISDINTDGIKIKADRVYYNDTFLRCQTGLVECSGGVSEDGKIRFTLSASAQSRLKHIDSMIEILAEEKGVDYHPISSTSLTVGLWTRFFDNNKAHIDNMSSMLSTEFTALILLDMSKIIMFNDKLMLSVTVQQVMVRTYNQLPSGCVIYTSLTDLRIAMTTKSDLSLLGLGPVDEACVSDGSVSDSADINELL